MPDSVEFCKRVLSGFPGDESPKPAKFNFRQRLIIHIAIAVSAILSTAFMSSAGEGNEATADVFSESPTVEEYVREYFEEVPVLTKVAYCESRYRQFTTHGDILRGKVNSLDVGVMQINERYHLKTANTLGLDIYTLEGNLAYAKHLYDKQGTQPWSASEKCWDNPHIAMK